MSLRHLRESHVSQEISFLAHQIKQDIYPRRHLVWLNVRFLRYTWFAWRTSICGLDRDWYSRVSLSRVITTDCVILHIRSLVFFLIFQIRDTHVCARGENNLEFKWFIDHMTNQVYYLNFANFSELVLLWTNSWKCSRYGQLSDIFHHVHLECSNTILQVCK